MTAPRHNEQSLSAACTDHAADELAQVGDDQQQADRLLAELEALLEEAKQLRTRYRPRRQEPTSRR